MLLPRYAKKCLACVSCQVPIEKLPNGSLLHPYLGWKEWQWWNCATQNGKCSPERPAKTRRAERELPFNIEQMFDDVPPLHQQRCFCMTQDDGVDWNHGNGLGVENSIFHRSMKNTWRKNMFCAQTSSFFVCDSSHVASYGELGAWPPSSSSSTDQTSVGVQNGKQIKVCNIHVCISTYCVQIQNIYIYVYLLLYLCIYIIYLFIYASINISIDLLINLLI